MAWRADLLPGCKVVDPVVRQDISVKLCADALGFLSDAGRGMLGYGVKWIPE